MSGKTKADARRRFVPEPESVWFGTEDKAVTEYKVVPVAWATLFELKDLLREILEDVTGLWNAEILTSLRTALNTEGQAGAQAFQELMLNPKVWELVQQLLEKPYKFFKLAIPDLEEVHFTAPSNPKSATIPQVWATFEVIAQVNHLDFAKNLLGSKPPQA